MNILEHLVKTIKALGQTNTVNVNEIRDWSEISSVPKYRGDVDKINKNELLLKRKKNSGINTSTKSEMNKARREEKKLLKK